MDLVTDITTYQSPLEAKQVLERARAVTISGLPGAGKDALKQETLNDPEFMAVVSHTTRWPRVNNGVNEKDGVDYHFVSRDYFENMMWLKKFIEVMPVYGNLYGTSIKDVSRSIELGKIAINDLDTQGVARYHELFDKVTSIFVVPPSYERWVERWRGRYSTEQEFNADFTKRRDGMLGELARALTAGFYHIVINDDLTEAAEEVRHIARDPEGYVQKENGFLVAQDIQRQLLDLAA